MLNNQDDEGNTLYYANNYRKVASKNALLLKHDGHQMTMIHSRSIIINSISVLSARIFYGPKTVQGKNDKDQRYRQKPYNERPRFEVKTKS